MLFGVEQIRVPTAFGFFRLVVSNSGVREVFFPETKEPEIRAQIPRASVFGDQCRVEMVTGAGLELIGYLEGHVRSFSTPVDGTLFSRFQRDIYGALVTIPYGETITYGQLARLAGHPGKARATGAAMHRNPAPIFIPCHRVVTASGGLGGWSGAPGWKKRLLELEEI
jgi:methylated-DNA-[protein]-cysteine S-methyltransferase